MDLELIRRWDGCYITKASPVHELPVELAEAILAHLEYEDLARVRNVCRSFRTLCTSIAIPRERRRMLQLRDVCRSDGSAAQVRRTLDPFFVNFDRVAYLARVGEPIPSEFERWVLETPREDVVGWHWPGLEGEHSRERYSAAGLDFIHAMMFSRHFKPGYTLLPNANVMEVEDPDYAAFNDMDPACPREVTLRESKVRALQVWADMSGFAPKITLLILSGTERWNGTVWETESQIPFRHSPESITSTIDVPLIWRKSLGTWTEYLETECRSLQERYRSFSQLKIYRMGRRGYMCVSSSET